MAASPLPFEFVVVGPPLSLQVKRRDRLEQWQAQIRRAALERWPSHALPVSTAVELSIVYYYDQVTILDTDNIIQPIQEALTGLVYTHNRCVSDIVSRGREISRGFQIRGVTPALAEGICSDQEFLQIKVASAPKLERLDP